MIVRSRQSSRVLQAAAFVASALVTLGVSWAIAVGQNPPDWPQVRVQSSKKCTASGTNCDTCAVPNSTYGCDSTLAGTPWGIGKCIPLEESDPQRTCEDTNFDCGRLLKCSTGIPTAFNCGKHEHCQ